MHNNDENEIIIGMVNQIVQYKMIGNSWDETILVASSIIKGDIAIGDADNDGWQNIVDNSGYIFEWNGDRWVNDNNLGYSEYSSSYNLAIGDADNDGKNEMGFGLNGPSSFIIYSNINNVWESELITHEACWSIAIGDADNNGNNEFVVGLSYGIRIYNYIPATVPSEPLNLESQYGDNYVSLSWDRPIDDGRRYVNNYTIYRGTSPYSLEKIDTYEFRLYYDETQWQEKQNNIFTIVNTVFNKEKNEKHFVDKFNTIANNLEKHRNKNFTGKMLRHHTMKSAMYMSQWIEAKNKLSNQK